MRSLCIIYRKTKTGLEGYSYKIKDGIESRTESLKIRESAGTWIYEATVPNQNDGKTIPFTQNLAEKSILSFENPAHDFPVKIQYKPINKDRFHVSVVGRDNKGFTYFIDRVKQ